MRSCSIRKYSLRVGTLSDHGKRFVDVVDPDPD
jgi:hypothetical protein